MSEKTKLVSPADWKTADTDGEPVGLVKATSCTPSYIEPKDIGGEERVIAWTVSTESRDRDGDRIKVAGWELTNFRKSPVVMWNHDYGLAPIGRAIKVWKDFSGPTGSRLRMLKQFTPEGMNPLADTVFEMAKNGFLNSASVGFIPKEFEKDPDMDEDDRQRHIFGGFLFKKQELLESSVVPIPSNPTAIQEARSIGINLVPYVEWAEKQLDGETQSHLFIPRKTLEEVYTLSKDTNGCSFTVNEDLEEDGEGDQEELTIKHVMSAAEDALDLAMIALSEIEELKSQINQEDTEDNTESVDTSAESFDTTQSLDTSPPSDEDENLFEVDLDDALQDVLGGAS